MGAAHGIKVMLLHQQNVFDHRGFIHHLPVIRVMFMTVGATDQQGLTVQLQQSAADFNFTETDVVSFGFNQRAAGIQQGNHGAIQMRRFSTPQLWPIDMHRQAGTIEVAPAFVNHRRAKRLLVAGNLPVFLPQCDFQLIIAGIRQ